MEAATGPLPCGFLEFSNICCNYDCSKSTPAAFLLSNDLRDFTIILRHFHCVTPLRFDVFAVDTAKSVSDFIRQPFLFVFELLCCPKKMFC